MSGIMVEVRTQWSKNKQFLNPNNRADQQFSRRRTVSLPPTQIYQNTAH